MEPITKKARCSQSTLDYTSVPGIENTVAGNYDMAISCQNALPIYLDSKQCQLVIGATLTEPF